MKDIRRATMCYQLTNTILWSYYSTFEVEKQNFLKHAKVNFKVLAHDVEWNNNFKAAQKLYEQGKNRL
jgi:hypothetical protein